VKIIPNRASTELPVAPLLLLEATCKTNLYLAKLPELFKSDGGGFYAVLNQRNLSGFIGEVLKHAIFSCDNNFIPNPHPDGRPDLLDLRSKAARAYFESDCHESLTNTPRREMLAPFRFGGIEIKCSIGKLKNAGDKPVGVPRVELVNGITYWAHHAHGCNLLGAYYDYDDLKHGAPQIRALFYTELLPSDWHKVSVGDPGKKKTSNTSLNKSGLKKLYQSLVMHHEDTVYIRLLDRLGISR
jgi:hypothetical protein